MRFRRLWILLCAAALAAGGLGAAAAAADVPFTVELRESDGFIRAEWTRLGDGFTYEVSVCDRVESTEGEVSLQAFARRETDAASIALSDDVAWYYQESGLDSVQYPMELVVTVVARRDGQRAAEGESNILGLTDFFPPEDAPAIGPDIPPGDITRFEWHSNGSYIEANFYFNVDLEGGAARLDAVYFDERGRHEIDAPAPESFRRELMDILCRGRLYRDYVMDPEIMILDGGDEYFRIEWKGMKASQRRYYRVAFDEADAEALSAALHRFG